MMIPIYHYLDILVTKYHNKFMQDWKDKGWTRLVHYREFSMVVSYKQLS